MNTEALASLATLYRTAQLYAHMAHNRTSGTSFFGDHSFLGDLYGTYESAYDSIVERVLGLGGIMDFAAVTDQAARHFRAVASDATTDSFFRQLASMESILRRQIDAALKGQSQGTTNLLQGLADESEVRTYKLKQRLKE